MASRIAALRLRLLLAASRRFAPLPRQAATASVPTSSQELGRRLWAHCCPTIAKSDQLQSTRSEPRGASLHPPPDSSGSPLPDEMLQALGMYAYRGGCVLSLGWGIELKSPTRQLWEKRLLATAMDAAPRGMTPKMPVDERATSRPASPKDAGLAACPTWPTRFGRGRPARPAIQECAPDTRGCSRARPA